MAAVCLLLSLGIIAGWIIFQRRHIARELAKNERQRASGIEGLELNVSVPNPYDRTQAALGGGVDEDEPLAAISGERQERREVTLRKPSMSGFSAAIGNIYWAHIQALEVEAGKLTYQVPDHMWLGTPETVEVRLGRQEAVGMMMGFVGTGEVKTADTPIVETMSVTLLGDDDAFLIEPRSDRDQLVKRDLVKGTAFQGDDFGRWLWRVTPKQSGRQTLLVKVSAAVKDSRGLPTTASLPDKLFPVTVRVHVVRATTAAIGRAVPAIGWAVVTALIGIFTRDYWWPFVRDWVGLG